MATITQAKRKLTTISKAATRKTTTKTEAVHLSTHVAKKLTAQAKKTHQSVGHIAEHFIEERLESSEYECCEGYKLSEEEYFTPAVIKNLDEISAQMRRGDCGSVTVEEIRARIARKS